MSRQRVRMVAACAALCVGTVLWVYGGIITLFVVTVGTAMSSDSSGHGGSTDVVIVVAAWLAATVGLGLGWLAFVRRIGRVTPDAFAGLSPAQRLVAEADLVWRARRAWTVVAVAGLVLGAVAVLG